MNDFNLLPSKHVHAQARRRRIFAWVIGAGVYVTVVTIGAVGTYAGTGPSRAAAQRERQEIERNIEAGKSEIAQLNKQLSDARHRLKTSSEVSKHPDWSILLKVLADLRDPSMLLDSVELSKITTELATKPAAGSKKKAPPPTSTRFVLKLSGLASNLASVPPFVLRLEGIGLFSSVKLVESRAAELNGRSVATFRVECTLTDAEGNAP